MVEPEEMKNRGMQVMYMHGFFLCTETEFIRGSMNITSLNPSTGHPHGKTMMVMVTTVDFSLVGPGLG